MHLSSFNEARKAQKIENLVFDGNYLEKDKIKAKFSAERANYS